MLIYTVTHLRANNDSNGNPRRCFVIQEIDTGQPRWAKTVAVYGEGYNGRAVYAGHYPSTTDMGTYDIEVDEYKELVNLGDRLRKES